MFSANELELIECGLATELNDRERWRLEKAVIGADNEQDQKDCLALQALLEKVRSLQSRLSSQLAVEQTSADEPLQCGVISHRDNRLVCELAPGHKGAHQMRWPDGRGPVCWYDGA
jgi:hypothetical protein